jgi:hypothetical protein
MVEFSFARRILQRSVNRLAGEPTTVYLADNVPHLRRRHLRRFGFVANEK